VPPEGPLLVAGAGWTALATSPLAAGDPVEVSGSGTVARAAAASLSFVGIAAHDCADGGLLTVVLGNPILVSVAGSDITAGELIMAADDPGQVTSTLSPRTRVYPPPARALGIAPGPAIYDPDRKVYPPPAVALGVAPAPAMYERVRVFPPPALAIGAAPPPQVIRPLPALALGSAPPPRIWVVALPALDIAAAAAPPPDDIPGIQVFPLAAWAAAAAPRPAGSADPYPGPGPAAAFASAPNPTVEGADVTVQLTTPARFSLAAVPAISIIPSVPAEVIPDPAETTAITGQAVARALFPAAAARAVTTAVPGQARVTGLAPTVTSVTPSSGTPNITVVTVRGTWFTPGSAVAFNGFACSPAFTFVDSTTQIRCYAPTGPANGTNTTVSVTTENGTGSLANAFTYTGNGNPPPAITGISPASGGAGTYVTVTGSNFFGGGLTSVDFGGFPADNVVVNTNAQLHCNVPAGPMPGPVDVTPATPAGVGPPRTGGFTYTTPPPVAPAVTGVSPNGGWTTGGTAVQLYGSGFTTASEVTFGGIAATGLIVNSDTLLICTAPAHAAGTVDVTVTNPAGQATLTGGFTYATPGVPVVTSCEPDSGDGAGGYQVAVNGDRFIGVTGVRFGTVAAAAVTVTSPLRLTCTVPAQPVGPVPVSVTNEYGTGTSPGNVFTYTPGQVAAPTVTSVTPDSGAPTTTQVTVAGSGFTPGSVVEFGPASGTRYRCSPDNTEVDSSTQIRCYPPYGPGAGTSCTCYVTTSGGTASRDAAFTYTSDGNPPPSVSGVTPASGSAGTQVTVDGDVFFAGQTSVDFGGFPAPDVDVDNINRLHCTAPAGPPAGPVDVTATTPAGAGPPRAGAFTYTASVTREAAALRAGGDLALLGVALTTALAGEVVLWLARRPRYPWQITPPAPLILELPPPPHGPVRASHAHEHDHGYGPHDHSHLHLGDDRHEEGPGHPHDLRSGLTNDRCGNVTPVRWACPVDGRTGRAT
jgi:hypothetical protein